MSALGSLQCLEALDCHCKYLLPACKFRIRIWQCACKEAVYGGLGTGQQDRDVHNLTVCTAFQLVDGRTSGVIIYYVSACTTEECMIQHRCMCRPVLLYIRPARLLHAIIWWCGKVPAYSLHDISYWHKVPCSVQPSRRL